MFTYILDFPKSNIMQPLHMAFSLACRYISCKSRILGKIVWNKVLHPQALYFYISSVITHVKTHTWRMIIDNHIAHMWVTFVL
jgi:hypothetical protein